MDVKNGLKLASALAMFLGACAPEEQQADTDVADDDGSELVKCEGINECAGLSECAGEGANACEGQNECAGQGWVTVSRDDCDEEGGSIIEEA